MSMPDEHVPAAPAAERRYQAILEKMVKHVQSAEVNNLRRYHSIGQLFTEFVNGLDGKKYGSATVERLANDLRDHGVLSDVADQKRFLYWAKNLSDCFPDFVVLEEMSSRGFTVSHAKLLFSLSPEVRGRVERQMIQDGRMVSTRELSDLVNEVQGQLQVELSQQAAVEHRKFREEPETPETAEADAPAAEEPPAEVDSPEAAEAADDGGEGNPELETPTAGDRPEGVPATGAPPRERTIKSPLKVLRAVQKVMGKVHDELPNTFIVIRETAQIGFDSDTAAERYMQQLRDVRQMAATMIEPVQELLRSIDQEMEAATVPPPTD